MGEIVVKNMNDLIVHTSTNGTSLLNALHENYIDWMHACGGKGRCTTCKCKVLEGMSDLSIRSSNEERFLKTNQLTEDERLTCQAQLKQGQVRIEVPEEYKLPHVNYSY
ncbi:MAG: 2Fe-2S iron-sulfur cluster-binding protein [Bacteroidota bacterium]